MDPLNDLIWNDEDELTPDMLPGDGPPMVQICQISITTCYPESGGYGFTSASIYTAGSPIGFSHCGC